MVYENYETLWGFFSSVDPALPLVYDDIETLTFVNISGADPFMRLVSDD